MWSRSRPGLRRSRVIQECPDWRPSGPGFLGKSQTGTGTAGSGPVRTGSQSVRDQTSPTLRDGIKEYKVEKILDSQILCRKVEYLVHWKGYGVEEDKWHPIHDVQGSKQLITKFHHTHKLLTLGQHHASGRCTFEGGVMSWFTPWSHMSF